MGDLTRVIEQLLPPIGERKGLGVLPEADPIPAKVGLGLNKGSGIGGGGGLASPFTETAYTDREYWADAEMITADGLFTLYIRPVKVLHFIDAGGSPAVFNFSQPTA